jgi:hypothetical protein
VNITRSGPTVLYAKVNIYVFTECGSGDVINAKPRDIVHMGDCKNNVSNAEECISAGIKEDAISVLCAILLCVVNMEWSDWYVVFAIHRLYAFTTF